MNESKVIEILNEFGYDFEKISDKLSETEGILYTDSYNAFDPDRGVILDIECRKRYYEDTLLERVKYLWNKDYAEANGFEFLYVVSMPDKEGHKLYIFEPGVMDDEKNYDFGWHTILDKEVVGYLHINDALRVIQTGKEGNILVVH